MSKLFVWYLYGLYQCMGKVGYDLSESRCKTVVYMWLTNIFMLSEYLLTFLSDIPSLGETT